MCIRDRATDYGRTLLAKQVLLAAALVAAIVLRRRHVELAVLSGLTAVAALLVSLPPPK